VELKKGFDEMVYLRKAVANNANRLANYVAGTVLPQIRKAFEAYYLGIAQEEGRQLQRREELGRREK
jgi:prophage antirepressor-like protein